MKHLTLALMLLTIVSCGFKNGDSKNVTTLKANQEQVAPPESPVETSTPSPEPVVTATVPPVDPSPVPTVEATSPPSVDPIPVVLATPAPTATPVPVFHRFIPKDLKISEAGKSYALLDFVTVPSGNYQIDNTVTVDGLAEFPYQFPILAENNCTGLGYDVSYEQRRKSITTVFKVVPYVNSKAVTLDHLVVAPTDLVQVAVYADYLPLADYLDNSALPSEFVKSFQPSNKCHAMCAMAQVKPTRDVIFNPAGRVTCTYFWNTADGGYSQSFPGTVTFNPAFWATQNTRDFQLTQLQACGAVQTNDDLKSYYDQATTGACQNSQKIMLKEWYFVEQKVPYNNPIYTIKNFSSLVKATTDTQSSALADQSIQLMSEWSK